MATTYTINLKLYNNGTPIDSPVVIAPSEVTNVGTLATLTNTPTHDGATLTVTLEDGEVNVSSEFDYIDLGSSNWETFHLWLTAEGNLEVVLPNTKFGNVRLPATATVKTGEAYGPSDTLAGTVVQPAEADVREATTYGPSGERVGTFAPTIVEAAAEGVTSGTTIEVINGDAYDGTNQPKLSWGVDKDYTGQTITLVVYDKHDETSIAGRFTGAVDSPTVVSVSMTADFSSGDVTIAFEGCPRVMCLGFALVAGTDETIARGKLYLYGRGTTA